MARNAAHLRPGSQGGALLAGVAVVAPAGGQEAPEAVELMSHAAIAAGADAGNPALLENADRVVVPKGTWSYADPGRIVAAAIGATRARTYLVDIGIPQQTLINDALEAILSGHAEVVIIVGGEARRRAQAAARQGAVATETDQGPARPDVNVTRPEGELIAPAEMAAGIVVPVEQYALIENALRAASGQSIAEHQAEIAALWSRFNATARDNPWAAFPDPMTPAQIATPGPHNRPLAFPYNKWHASQWNVDQAAALVLCSAQAARRHGVVPERCVLPVVGLESSAVVSLSRRADLAAWPAMNVLGRAAAARIRRPVSEVEMVELYSCFPSAVRVQQRELSLPGAGTPTLTGGMAFAGGPFNNFVLQATATMAQHLREHPGALGAVTTVSGMLTKPGLAIWSTQPDGEPPLVGDLGPEVAATTRPLAISRSHTGPATVASYTVTYQDETPCRVVVIADGPEGRCVATSTDAELAAQALAHDIVGAAVRVEGATFQI